MLTKTTLAIVAVAALGFASSAMAAPKHYAKHQGDSVRVLRTAAYAKDLRLQGNFSASPVTGEACGSRDPDAFIRMSLSRECQQGL